jgi:hypothetical protein
MKTRMIFLACLFVFCLHNVCFANPFFVFRLPSFGGLFDVNPWYAVLIDCIVDFISLLIGYLVVKEVRYVARVAFLPYFGLVFVGGIVADAIAMVPAFIFALLLPADLGMLAFFVCTGLLLYFYNYFLSKKFFKLQRDQAIVIGVLIGILTNPAVGWVLANVFGVVIH